MVVSWLLSVSVAVLLLADQGCFASSPLERANAAFSNGEYTAAIRLYTEAIDKDSSSSLLHTKRAATYMSLKQLNSALRDLNKAVEFDSAFVQGYLTRAKLHRQLCNFDAAQRDYEKVLELRPGQKSASAELEKMRMGLENFNAFLSQVEGPHVNIKDAKPLFDSLYDFAQDCARVQLAEAQLYMKASEYEQAVATTGKLLKADERNLAALLLRGNAYFYLYDHDMAKRHYGEVLKYDPDHQDARHAFNKVKSYDKVRTRADKALKAGDYKEAAEAFTEGLHMDHAHRKGNVGLWFGLCKARANLGSHQQALEACKNTLILEHGHGEAKQQIVETYWAMEQWQEAFNVAKQYWQENQGDHTFMHLVREAERKLKMSLRKDYYKILGVAQGASDREIRKAYREAAVRTHPDKVALEERPAAEEKFREVAEAYEVLSDEQKRARYDAGEEVNEPQGHPGQHFHQGHPFHHQQQYEFRFN